MQPNSKTLIANLNMAIVVPHSLWCSSSSSSLSVSSSSSLSSFEDEDYIDLEVSSHTFFHSPTCSSQNISTREFEFHMSSDFLDAECTTNSLADELFYKGKLLPLHLPPRLQMVEKIVKASNGKEVEEEEEEEFYGTPLATPPPTPFLVCHESRELSLSDYFAEETLNFVGESSTKLWRRKIKELIRQSLFKTSKRYMKSLFGKSSCSHVSCATTIYEGSTIKAKDRTPKIRHKQVQNSFCKEKDVSSKPHVVLKKDSECWTTSSSAGLNSEMGKRINDLIDNPIQGAIKHCKLSQSLGTTVDELHETNGISK